MFLILSLLVFSLQPTTNAHDSHIPVSTVQYVGTNPDDVRAYTHKVSRSRGYSTKQWRCFDTLITRESHWHHNSVNGKHYGLGQVANMKAGTPVPKQLDIIFKYIKHRYGTACSALHHSNRYNWY